MLPSSMGQRPKAQFRINDAYEITEAFTQFIPGGWEAITA